jgi:hypothetical protein
LALIGWPLLPVAAQGLGPSDHKFLQFPVAGVIDIELVPVESVEASEHLAEDVDLEAEILLRGELAEAEKVVVRLEGGEVNEVPSFGSAEDGQDFVDSQFVGTEQLSVLGSLGRKEPSVGGQVHPGLLRPLLIGDDESRESRSDLLPGHDERFVPERFLQDGEEQVDIGWFGREEVKIASWSVHDAVSDQRRTAGQDEALGLIEAGEAPDDSLLEVAQHAWSRER